MAGIGGGELAGDDGVWATRLAEDLNGENAAKPIQTEGAGRITRIVPCARSRPFLVRAAKA